MRQFRAEASDREPRVGFAVVAVGHFHDAGAALEFREIPFDFLRGVVARWRGFSEHFAVGSIEEAHEVFLPGGLVGKAIVTAKIKAEFFRQRERCGAHDAGAHFAMHDARKHLRFFPIGARALLKTPRDFALARRHRPAGAARFRGEQRGGDFTAPIAERGVGRDLALLESVDRALHDGGLGIEIGETFAGERDERIESVGGQVFREARELFREDVGGDFCLLEDRKAEQRVLFSGDGEHDVQELAKIVLRQTVERKISTEAGRAELIAQRDARAVKEMIVVRRRAAEQREKRADIFGRGMRGEGFGGDAGGDGIGV